MGSEMCIRDSSMTRVVLCVCRITHAVTAKLTANAARAVGTTMTSAATMQARPSISPHTLPRRFPPLLQVVTQKASALRRVASTMQKSGALAGLLLLPFYRYLSAFYHLLVPPGRPISSVPLQSDSGPWRISVVVVPLMAPINFSWTHSVSQLVRLQPYSTRVSRSMNSVNSTAAPPVSRIPPNFSTQRHSSIGSAARVLPSCSPPPGR